MDALIIGGGIAGLSAAFHLSRAGMRVRLLEREPVLCAHASGRNAAIFRHLEVEPEVTALAKRSGELLEMWVEGWLHRTGALYVASRPAALAPLAAVSARLSVQSEPAAPREAAPALSGTALEHGLLVPGDGAIDIHRVTSALARGAREAGATLSLGAEVERVLVERGRVAGAKLRGGEALLAERVVIAGGAWAGELGAGCGAPLPLTPLRRHLAQLEPSVRVSSSAPVVWSVEEPLYFRPESGGVLASPCDEEPPDTPDDAGAALASLWRKLESVAPRLSGAGVRRVWSCLRTFAPDRLPVVGPDPRVFGLHWLAGLGGAGMTAGLALGEALAAGVLARSSSLAAALAPERLLVSTASESAV